MRTLLHSGLAAVALALVCVAANPRIRASSQAAAPTGRISGVVVTDDTPSHPIRRAVVTAASAEFPEGLGAITDDDGMFSIGGLPAGRFPVTAKRSGYLPGTMGAARPGRAGIPVVLSVGQSFTGQIRLGRAGVISGVVRDERGAPMAGLRVFAIGARGPQSPSSAIDLFTSNRSALTDDRGVYRLYELPPGSYLVCAGLPLRYGDVGPLTAPSTADNDAILARLRQRNSVAIARPSNQTSTSTPSEPTRLLTPIFFPGTPSPAEAAKITLGPGDLREGLDFAMSALPASEISGFVVNPSGMLPSSIQLSITPSSTFKIQAMAFAYPKLERGPGSDGGFRYSQIAPGRYVLSAKADRVTVVGPGHGFGDVVSELEAVRGASVETMYAVEEIDVANAPVSGVVLRLQPGAVVSGRLVMSPSVKPYTGDITNVRVSLVLVGASSFGSMGGTLVGNAFGEPLPVRLKPDGTFQFAGVAPGRYHARITVPADAASWWPRDVIANGVDIIDGVLDLSAGASVDGVVATLTDRPTELTGSLTSGGRLAAADCTVIAIPMEPALRETGSRRLKVTRPGTDGIYSFRDLPAGRYVLVVLTDADPDEWQSPDFLARIAPAGVPVTVTEGARTVQNLRISGRP